MVFTQIHKFCTTQTNSSSPKACLRLIYECYGEPANVLQLKKDQFITSRKLVNNEVKVRWLASPINPSDINQMQGIYAVKPPLPACAGIEGYGEVEDVASTYFDLKPGDRVLSAMATMGTWQSQTVSKGADFYKIDARIPLEYACTLQINPCTAYRMLYDYVKLQKGDVVVQNGANSAVGKNVIQIASQLGLQTVNVVRDRPTIADLKAELKQLGATEVFTEEEFAQQTRKIKSHLALNCVGGKSSYLIARTLQQNGKMVTYGGMSKQPVQGATGPFIFQNVKFEGFWLTGWYRKMWQSEKLLKERDRMFGDLTAWILDGKFVKPQLTFRKPEEFKDALEKAQDFKNGKQVYKFNEEMLAK